jgi:hypothetical protein
MRMTRKDFLKASVGAVSACAGLLALGACGSSNSGGSTASCSNGINTDIGNNHPPPGEHEMTVSLNDLKLGTDKLYHIQGHADHDHTVTLTEEDFQNLQSGGTIQEASSVTAEHQHLITVVCG